MRPSAVGAGDDPVTTLTFAQPRGLADLATFVARARRVQPDGALRLQTVGSLLVVTVAVLEGQGLLGEGTVLGLRAVPLADAGGHAGADATSGDGELDVTVGFASVADRLARDEAGGGFSVPPVTVSVAWAGLAPPRGGWEPVGQLSGQEVDDIARQGIAEVAQGTPPGAGAQAVETLRRRVWGVMSETVPPVRRGLAFGAHVLGFVEAGGAASVSTHGRWTRLSTPRGHVLVR
ncbi:hypothetical protein DFJ68_0447 [Terracoccus luteus]|uniref:Uncharacterized protein n=1 Tax=Terracoccus luteus TaxID=53356 RepID=A0A495XWC8_9MICO|nr:hypothetical protein [Terracoccus luteus]RKT77036.1 hypothetical protein DFJ68_0447 [Terracoccus luteus]